MTVMIAVKSGLVRIDGRRRRVDAGRTTADQRHPLVEAYPHLWAQIRPDYAVDVDEHQAPDAAADVDEHQVLADELERLCAGLRERGITSVDADPDEPPATTIVTAALAALDRLLTAHDTGRPTVLEDPVDEDQAPTEQPDDEQADDPAPAAELDRAAVRRWAAEQGIDVAPYGKLPAAVVDQYIAAHQEA